MLDLTGIEFSLNTYKTVPIQTFFSWGISALICDVSDFFPENLTAATEPIQHVNLMPCYGLNVHSILKHKTLVLTVDAVNYLEEKLLYAMNRSDYAQKRIKSSTSGYSLF